MHEGAREAGRRGCEVTSEPPVPSDLHWVGDGFGVKARASPCRMSVGVEPPILLISPPRWSHARTLGQTRSCATARQHHPPRHGGPSTSLSSLTPPTYTCTPQRFVLRFDDPRPPQWFSAHAQRMLTMHSPKWFVRNPTGKACAHRSWRIFHVTTRLHIQFCGCR